MFNSKALKPKKFRWQYEDEDKNLFQSLVYYFKKFFIWPVSDNYRWISRSLKRSYDYARFGWDNYDWDFAYTYDLMEFKLKRLKKALLRGCSIQEPEDMAALEELIQVVGRLRNYDDYSNSYLDAHNLKWGATESRTEPWVNENGKRMGSTWIAWRKNCPENAPKELKEMETKEFRTCFEQGESDRMRDMEKMFEILKARDRRWWD